MASSDEKPRNAEPPQPVGGQTPQKDHISPRPFPPFASPYARHRAAPVPLPSALAAGAGLHDNEDEARLDLTPLLDVIFLLLTFFAFTVVLLVRAEVLDVRLPSLGPGTGDANNTVLGVTLLADGTVAIDGDPTSLESLPITIETALERLATARAASDDEAPPETAATIAVDENAPAGTLLQVVQELRAAGIDRLAVLGRAEGDTPTPGDGSEAPTPPGGSEP